MVYTLKLGHVGGARAIKTTKQKQKQQKHLLTYLSIRMMDLKLLIKEL
jgi:hypothetical protein